MLVLLLLLAQGSPVEQYLAEKDASARSKLLRKIRGSVAEVESRIRKPPPPPAPDETGTVVRKKLKAAHPLGIEFEYLLWVPKAYTPEKRWRLLIDLHGQSGTGDSAIRRWLSDLQRTDDIFLLCPSARRGGWGRSLLGHAYIRSSMRDVMATYAIDPDLVFLDGASMGGNGSFQFACRFPDLFAGAMPRSGGPMFRYVKQAEGRKTVTAEGVENLVALPLYWVVGAKDHEVPNAWVKVARAQIEKLKSDFTFREYPNGGHEWFPQENARVLEWMEGRRRNPYPPRVSVHTNDRNFRRNYWLEISQFKGREMIQRGFRDLKGQHIEDRKIFHEFIRVDAELVPDTNEIRVTSTGARELTIYLHERMVDLSKAVVVRVNGARRQFRPKPSVTTLMESARRDRGLLYSAKVKVRPPVAKRREKGPTDR